MIKVSTLGEGRTEVHDMTAELATASRGTVAQRVRQFIVENFFVIDPAVLADDASLITGGFVDSTGLLEIITFLEAEYGIRVLDLETIPENLETIGRIAAFVARKRKATAG